MTAHEDTLSEPCACPQGMRFHALNCPIRPGQHTVRALVAERDALREDVRLALDALPDPMHPEWDGWAFWPADPSWPVLRGFPTLGAAYAEADRLARVRVVIDGPGESE